MKKLPIIERREFYDVPRSFVVLYDGEHFLFESAFDEELDDYTNDYRVYRMGTLAKSVIDGSWESLAKLAVEDLGRIPIDEVQFDETRRRWIDARVLERFLVQS